MVQNNFIGYHVTSLTAVSPAQKLILRTRIARMTMRKRCLTHRIVRHQLQDKAMKQIYSSTFSILWLIILVGSPDEVAIYAQEYEIGGALAYEAYGLKGEVLVRWDFDFVVQVKDGGWRIKTRPRNMSADQAILASEVGSEASSNGVIYEINYFNPDHDRNSGDWEDDPLFGKHGRFAGNSGSQQPRAVRLPINRGVGEVYYGDFPTGNMTFAAPLWLAYASSRHLDGASNRIAKVWIDGERFTPKTIKANWSRIETLPFLPKSIDFFNEGLFFKELEDGTVARIKQPVPYDNGFKEGRYEVSALTNVGNYTFPAEFKLLRYDKVPGATMNTELRKLLTIQGQLLYARESPSLDLMIPPVKEPIMITDFRFDHGKSRDHSFSYLQAPGPWRSIDQIEKSPAYRRTLKGQPARGRDSGYRKLVLILLTICPLTVYFLYRKAVK